MIEASKELIWPPAETLGFLAPHVPEPLVRPDSFSKLRKVADLLPPAITSYTYLECRLGADSPQVDYLTCITAQEGRPRLFPGHAGAPEAPADFAGWTTIQRFLKRWSETESALYDQVPLVWMEFDLPESADVTLPPNFGFCADPELKKLGARGDTNARRRSVRACREGLAILLETAPEAVDDCDLQRLLQLLPPDAAILHVSVFAARSPVEFKLSLALPAGTLRDYLRRLDWPTMDTKFGESMDLLIAPDDVVQVDLTLRESKAARVGLEFCSLAERRQDPRRRALLRRLADLGVADKQKLELAAGWSGRTRELYAGHSLPTSLVRWLDAKLVFDRAGGMEAKVYLGFAPRFSFC